MSKGQKFLKVTSILMIIGGALAGVSCLLGIAGVAMLASLADGHAAALMLYLALALALAAAVAEFIAGLKGLKTCKTGGDAHKCVVWGAVVAGITVVSSVMNVAGGGSVSAMSILLSLVVPGLYIYGAMQVQKGDWQSQQPKTAQAVQQPQKEGVPAAPGGQRLPHPVHTGVQIVVKEVIDVLIVVVKGVAGQTAVLHDVADSDFIQGFRQQQRPERRLNCQFGGLLHRTLPLSKPRRQAVLLLYHSPPPRSRKTGHPTAAPAIPRIFCIMIARGGKI